MSTEPPLVPFEQVVAVLRQLHRERGVGTLYVTTADNKSATVSFLGGEIVGVSFRVLRGRDALLLIKGIGLCRWSFHDGKVPDTDPDLPPTSEILALFGAPAEATPPPPRAARPETGPIRQVLEKELVEFLGPMARIVCQEHMEKAGSLATPEDVGKLVDGLAREIPDRKQAEAFKRAAWEKLPV